MKIYVGNLPFSTNTEELRSLFEEHGQVEAATVITDRHTGRSRGFGFVEMQNVQQAQTAMDALHDTVLGGRPLVVNKARPRGERRGNRPRGTYSTDR